MANVTATLTKIKASHAPYEVTFNAATEATASTAQTFELAIDRADIDVLLLIQNGGDAAITYSFGEGILGQPLSLNDATVNSVAAGKTAAVKIDTSFTMGHDGKVMLTLTPASGKAITTAKVAVIENAQSYGR
jgi:hypothetical protein